MLKWTPNFSVCAAGESEYFTMSLVAAAAAFFLWPTLQEIGYSEDDVSIFVADAIGVVSACPPADDASLMPRSIFWLSTKLVDLPILYHGLCVHQHVLPHPFS